MPELPEVETIRSGLEKYIVGQEIADIDIRLKKQFTGDPKLIIGSKVTGVRRLGKGLVIDFANNYSLAVHVKMTGQLIFRGPEIKNEANIDLPNKWTHVIFKLKSQKSPNYASLLPRPTSSSRKSASTGQAKIKDTKGKLNIINRENSSFLFYNDIRQFGWIKVVKTADLFSLPFFKSLGSEPLKDLTFEKFSAILRNSKTPIKLLLMDQTKIAGIGNIYANDALFEARIHPKRPSSSLSDPELKNLFKAQEAVLKKGIEVGGASQWNYVNALGERGGYQNFFKVYNQAGKKCPDCCEIIKRFKMGGRGTFICEKCQK